MSKPNRRIGNALLVVAGITFGFLLVELGLRMIHYRAPNFYRSDFYTGASLQEGIEGWWTKEGKAYVKINSDGLRDREHRISKPSNTFRIAVLGDSYAEAMQVSMEDAFWKVLERSLQQCPTFQRRQVEVINFGVAGFGTAQELLTLRHRALKYSPDVVLLAFLSGNDVRNNMRALEQDPMRPYFVFQDNTLVPDDSFREDPGWRFRQSIMINGGYWLIDHVRVLQLLNESRSFIKQRYTQFIQNGLAAELSQGFTRAQPNPGEAGIDTLIYIEPSDLLWQNAWSVTEALLILINNEVEQQGAEFLVVTLTNGDQVDPNPKLRRASALRLGVPDLLYPERRVAAVGNREGFPVLNLAQPFADYAERNQVYLHGFKNGGGHWNSAGHHLAGELISEKICSYFEPTVPKAIGKNDEPNPEQLGIRRGS